MDRQQRKDAFVQVGDKLRLFLDKEQENEKIAAAMELAEKHNQWFTQENIRHALKGVAYMLERERLDKWLSAYSKEDVPAKTIGVIMAGNIPLVGFHDMLSVLLSGNHLLAKTSDNDKILPQLITDMLIEVEVSFKSRIILENSKLSQKPDAIIATGNNNSARYFEYYFGKYPHIIRKNRNSVAVITGEETEEALMQLGEDVFRYFGLGCRNVSKLYIPEDYDVQNIFKALYPHKDIIDHHKYANNYTYNRTIYLMDAIDFLDNGFVMIREDIALSSPIAVLNIEKYSSTDTLKERLQMDEEHIQCVVTQYDEQIHARQVSLGKAQLPEPWDYADGVDTMEFLFNL